MVFSFGDRMISKLAAISTAKYVCKGLEGIATAYPAAGIYLILTNHMELSDP